MTITGPQILLDRVAQLTARRKSCDFPEAREGFWIGWGDEGDAGHWTVTARGPLGPDGCPNPLQHRYAVPGEFKIHAGLFHRGPSDGLISDWGAGAAVSIAAPVPDLFLEITRPGESEIMFSGGIPVSWNLSTPGPIDLNLEIAGRDGTVFGKRLLRGLNYVGAGDVDVPLHWSGSPHQSGVVVRARVTESDREILAAESEPFLLSPRLGALVPMRVDQRGLDVRLTHRTPKQGCHSYSMDWGDGSPLHAVEKSCAHEPADVVSEHRYGTPGTYRMIFRSSAYDQAVPLSGATPYRTVSVTIPSE